MQLIPFYALHILDRSIRPFKSKFHYMLFPLNAFFGVSKRIKDDENEPCPFFKHIQNVDHFGSVDVIFDSTILFASIFPIASPITGPVVGPVCPIS